MELGTTFADLMYIDVVRIGRAVLDGLMVLWSIGNVSRWVKYGGKLVLKFDNACKLNMVLLCMRFIQI